MVADLSSSDGRAALIEKASMSDITCKPLYDLGSLDDQFYWLDILQVKATYGSLSILGITPHWITLP